MDALAKNLDIKIMSLHPEPRIIAAPEETVESVFDFSGLLGSAPPSGADDNFSSWLISAERRLGKPSPAYTIPAVSERLTELTVSLLFQIGLCMHCVFHMMCLLAYP